MTERFELLSQLGKGGMGVVWKARDTETGEIIALKLLHEMFADDPDYVARLEREVEIARRIESPHVVKVLGYGRDGGVPYIAMEYVVGQSLREVLRARGKLSWEEAKPILLQAAQGLAAVHESGAVHRDVKPSNILIAADGGVKLADFGIAKASDLTGLTGSATMLGTPMYMAPDLKTTAQSDLYALGCVLYEMLAGAPPFTGDSQSEVVVRHIREEPDLKKLPPEARPIAAWLLAKDRLRRAPSAAAVVAALSGRSKITGSGVRPPRRRWQVAAMIGAAALVVAGGVAVVIDFPLNGGAEANLSTGHGAALPASVPTQDSVFVAASPSAPARPVIEAAATTPPSTPVPTATPVPPTATRVVPPTATPSAYSAVPPTPTAVPPTPELPTATATSPAFAGVQDLAIQSATNGWVATGILVKRGSQLIITATGAWDQGGQSYSAHCYHEYITAPSGPDSLAPGHYQPGGWTFPAPGLTVYCLVGKIGDAAPFEVSSQYEGIPQFSGELFLAVNDDFTPDNSGTISVQVGLTRSDGHSR